MAMIPYLIKFTATVAANALHTFNYQTANDEQFELLGIRQLSTAGFDVYGLHTSDGLQYGNLSQSNPIPSEFIGDVANQFNGLIDLPIHLLMKPGTSLYVDVQDTSGSSNVVQLLISAIRRTGGDVK